MSAPPRWPDLPPELLAVVSGGLHVAADYVRFHAVCKPWRESLPASTALRPFLLPWLVARPSSHHSSWDLDMKLRCVFSKKSYLEEVPRRFSRHTWVTSADGTAAWFFSAFPEPTLVDHLTGDATSLPPFVCDVVETKLNLENSRGVMYGDGTVFLYNFSQWVYNKEHDYYEKPGEWENETSISFTAAILRPGDTAWKFVCRWFDDFDMGREEFLYHSYFFAAYRVYDGRILVHLDGDDQYVDTWHLLPPVAGDHTSVKREDDFEMTRKTPEGEVVVADSHHVLESRGELLRLSVLIQSCIGKHGAYEESAPLAVSVHALEEEVDADGRHSTRWVRRDGRSFADRVMFLGFPTSFAVEASSFRGGVDDVSGGCVYFLQPRSASYGHPGVFRYNLNHGKVKLLERLPLELIDRDSQTFTWLMPQPGIAPVQVIREKMGSPERDDRFISEN